MNLIEQGDATNLAATDVDLIYIDPPFFTQRHHGDFDDRWETLDHYIEWLTKCCQNGWNALKVGGNFIIHLDWHASHEMKVALDKAFGRGNFQNEIVWPYNSGGASKRRLSRKHDTLLWYTKPGAEYTFNVQREPYPHAYSGPAFHPDGRMLTDVWTDIGFIGTSSSERVGYATQKPVKLLERIVTIFSNEGDTVLDYFCGSGTTGVAAKKLGRNYILFDANPEAIIVARKRLG